MKKKFLALLLATAISASMIGCAAGESPEPVQEVTEQESNEESTEVTTESCTSETSEEKNTEDTEKEDNSALVTGENMLKNGDFSEGTDPWYTFCQNGNAELSVNGDGALDVDIKSVGTVAHGVQLYHDGFSLEEGCVYKIAFDAASDVDGKILEMRFQLNGGDYHAYYLENVTVGKDKQHYEYTFTMNETGDPAPRFCFNMGAIGDMDSKTPEHHVYLGNVVLTLEDATNRVAGNWAVDIPDIAVNQIGYLKNAYKSATLRGSALSGSAVLVNEDTGETVFEKKIGSSIDDPDTGEKEAIFNFTDITDEGTYHVEAGSAVSPSFKISDDVYDEAFRASIKMLYYQRCGTELTKDLAGDFAHPVCHTQNSVLYEDRSKTLDVTGGWHDAGDYGRYSVAGAKAVADLLLAYENYPDVFDDNVGIPESGNGIPDVLDEARYELDWLLKMQREDGGVYHKVTCRNFPGEIMPENETEELVIMPVTTTATADLSGVMAMASRVYSDIDKEFADRCLEAAKKAADYIDKTEIDTVGYKNPSDISTGEYEDVCDIDERFWAYAELYKTTGDKSYEESLKTVLPDNGYSLGWQGVAGYGGYAYLSAKDLDADTKAKVIDEAERYAKEVISNSAKYSYGSSIVGEYPWGSNLTIANNGEYLFLMNGLIDKVNKNVADMQLNYLFGNNSTGYSFLTGFGTLYADHPHHRPSQAMGVTVPGMLVGGPNSGLNDAYVQNVLKGSPSAKCYADNSQSYSTNEITIYWNSPLIYLLAAEMAQKK
ncbi:MAG: glycoside hydrolase family 9 protein [Butyrivibrio sp.]|nr:glycoside hydrolase family 9 protein [Butyrivibrio sp.]